MENLFFRGKVKKLKERKRKRKEEKKKIRSRGMKKMRGEKTDEFIWRRGGKRVGDVLKRGVRGGVRRRR